MEKDITSMKSEIAPFTIICAMCAGMGFAAHHPHHECPFRHACEVVSMTHQPDSHERDPAPTSTKEIATTVVSTSAAPVNVGWMQTDNSIPRRGDHSVHLANNWVADAAWLEAAAGVGTKKAASG
jgi:hypothetical protein